MKNVGASLVYECMDFISTTLYIFIMPCSRTGIIVWLKVQSSGAWSWHFSSSADVANTQNFRPGTKYPHVTWAHVTLRVRLGCERRFNIEFYGADSHFSHSAYVTWSHVELWSAFVPASLWEACCHVSRPELHVRSRDVSRVTEVWLCAIEFHVKSPLTSQPYA